MPATYQTGKTRMISWAIAYIAVLAAMAGMDFCWLSLTAGPVYHRALGAVMAENPNMIAATAFYLLYGAGVVIFAVRPGLQAGDWRMALLWGALFGFFAYATYDLTNLATLKVWSLKISLLDMAWGAVITATSAGLSAWVTLALRK
jgi:uncharacterized membrane protein